MTEAIIKPREYWEIECLPSMTELRDARKNNDVLPITIQQRSGDRDPILSTLEASLKVESISPSSNGEKNDFVNIRGKINSQAGCWDVNLLPGNLEESQKDCFILRLKP